jgi:hypothetical protein
MILEKQAPGNYTEPLKTCTDCQERKTLDQFYRRTRRATVNSYCKTCAYLRSRRWTQENPEITNATKRKSWLKRYNLTPEEYDSLLAAQGGICAICKIDKPGGKGSFHVDHDHACCPEKERSCGKCIRGLLCNNCNRNLAGQNPEILRRAADYIEIRSKV